MDYATPVTAGTRVPSAAEVFFKQLNRSGTFRVLTLSTLALTIVVLTFTILDSIVGSTGFVHSLIALGEFVITLILGFQLYVAYRAQGSSTSSQVSNSTGRRNMLVAFFIGNNSASSALKLDLVLFIVSLVCLIMHYMARNGKWAIIFRELEWVAIVLRCWFTIFRVVILAARTSERNYRPTELDFLSLNAAPTYGQVPTQPDSFAPNSGIQINQPIPQIPLQQSPPRQQASIKPGTPSSIPTYGTEQISPPRNTTGLTAAPTSKSVSPQHTANGSIPKVVFNDANDPTSSIGTNISARPASHVGNGNGMLPRNRSSVDFNSIDSPTDGYSMDTIGDVKPLANTNNQHYDISGNSPSQEFDNSASWAGNGTDPQYIPQPSHHNLSNMLNMMSSDSFGSD